MQVTFSNHLRRSQKIVDSWRVVVQFSDLRNDEKYFQTSCSLAIIKGQHGSAVQVLLHMQKVLDSNADLIRDDSKSHYTGTQVNPLVESSNVPCNSERNNLPGVCFREYTHGMFLCSTSRLKSAQGILLQIL